VAVAELRAIRSRASNQMPIGMYPAVVVENSSSPAVICGVAQNASTKPR
jgi:hypothetical protein